VFTAPRSTGVEDVRVYLVANPIIRASLRALPVLAPALGVAAVRNALASLLSRGDAGPPEPLRAARRSVVYGEATDPSGRRVASLQRHPDPYGLTALAAVEIAARALRGEAPPGWQTPGTAYGPDLVLSLPGVAREDL
jgi:short subunit dehydrogenase-like uncharacterized protein